MHTYNRSIFVQNASRTFWLCVIRKHNYSEKFTKEHTQNFNIIYVHKKKKEKIEDLKILKSNWYISKILFRNWIIYKNIKSMLYKVTIFSYVLSIDKFDSNTKQYKKQIFWF